jgi:hypothetical protein
MPPHVLAEILEQGRITLVYQSMRFRLDVSGLLIQRLI